MAAFLLSDRQILRVISVGIGTKFISSTLIQEDKESGRRVHDSHAEPLARRALLCWLYRQIDKLLDAEERQAAAAAGDLSLPADDSPSSSCASAVCRVGPSDAASPPQLRLRPGLSLHLYCSSCPCGNAALRRWAHAGERGAGGL